MSRHFLVTLAILFAISAPLAGPVSADVFERDFVPGSSDGLLTYDDVNRRDWLDVTVFANSTAETQRWLEEMVEDLDDEPVANESDSPMCRLTGVFSGDFDVRGVSC